jgi:hypothetical protein
MFLQGQERMNGARKYGVKIVRTLETRGLAGLEEETREVAEEEERAEDLIGAICCRILCPLCLWSC